MAVVVRLRNRLEVDGDHLRGSDQRVRVVGVLRPECVKHLAIGLCLGHTAACEADGEIEPGLRRVGDETHLALSLWRDGCIRRAAIDYQYDRHRDCHDNSEEGCYLRCRHFTTWKA
jgi:hypothetical protein